jgi:predicted Zn-dependent peptidase
MACDIAYRAVNGMVQCASDLKLPDGMELLSFDHGITHARIKSNGMKVAIVPFGKGGTVMMRRFVEGGSRLESPDMAGTAHVLEHADFRVIDWNTFKAMNMNAETGKLGIAHHAHMLLDPLAGHIATQFAFQKETMLGNNIMKMSSGALIKEVNNVKDEGLFNGQYGMRNRAMIMEAEKLLVLSVWDGGRVGPTIGDNNGQSISVTEPSDLLRLHKQLRGPSRTTMLLAGPLDTNAALQAVSTYFDDLRIHDDLSLRPLPRTRPPSPIVVAGNVTTGANTRGLAIAFVVPPYGELSNNMVIIQQLTGMLGSQPVLEENGVTDIGMYYNPHKEASVAVFLASVAATDPIEERAMCRAQEALMEFVIKPLQTFQQEDMLTEMLRQYRSMISETAAGGPQEMAALAMQGIHAAEMPSLAWHAGEMFVPSKITIATIQATARSVFTPLHMAIVRSTQTEGSVGLAPLPRAVGPSSRLSLMGRRFSPGPTTRNFPLRYSTAHVPAAFDGTRARVPQYIGPGQNARIERVPVIMRGKTVGVVAYNTSQVLPLTRKKLTAVFGSVRDYGGWANAQVTAAAMNTIAKATGAQGVKFSVEGSRVMATVADSLSRPAAQAFERPLVSTIAMASALINGHVSGAHALLEQLPSEAVNAAEKHAHGKYDDISYMAQAQLRSILCSKSSNGYMPGTYEKAIQTIYAAQGTVIGGIRTLVAHPPHLVGTNTSCAMLSQVAVNLLQVQGGSAPAHPAILSRTWQAPTSAARVTLVQEYAVGIKTFPYVAGVKGSRTLLRQDRAAFILTNQLMVGGMGAAFSHDIRQRGVSYRPSGGVQLSWGDEPVLTLNATFDQTDLEVGTERTRSYLESWRTGDAAVFTEERFEAARTTLLEQLQLHKMEFGAIQYDLLALLDERKFSSTEFAQELNNLTFADMSKKVRKYFTPGTPLKEAIVRARQ